MLPLKRNSMATLGSSLAARRAATTCDSGNPISFNCSTMGLGGGTEGGAGAGAGVGAGGGGAAVAVVEEEGGSEAEGGLGLESMTMMRSFSPMW